MAITKQCGFCNKIYKRISSFKEHTLICEEVHKSKYLNDIDEKTEEELAIPSMKQMYKIVRAFVVKYDALEKEVAILRKYVNKTKKRVNVLEWLTENKQLPLDFDAWLKTLHATPELLEYVFENNYITGAIKLLKNYLDTSINSDFPIKAFTQNKSCFYIFNDNKWQIMNDRTFCRLIANVNKHLFTEFRQWEIKHKAKMTRDSSFYQNTYVKNMKTLLGDNKPDEYIHKKIRTQLYTHLKQNLKHIIEYEFCF